MCSSVDFNKGVLNETVVRHVRDFLWKLLSFNAFWEFVSKMVSIYQTAFEFSKEDSYQELVNIISFFKYNLDFHFKLVLNEAFPIWSFQMSKSHFQITQMVHKVTCQMHSILLSSYRLIFTFIVSQCPQEQMQSWSPIHFNTEWSLSEDHDWF